MTGCASLPAPNSKDGSVLDLNGFFGLHPSLAPLKPMFDTNALAIVEAAGSPDPTRSHFDAQDYMESGTPGRKATSDGWLNRALLPTATNANSPVRAVSMGAELARALRGTNSALAVNNLNEFKVRDETGAATFENMYAATLDKAMQGTGRDTFDAVKMLQTVQKQPYVPANGAKYPNGGLGRNLQQIAQLMRHAHDIGTDGSLGDY